MRAQRVVDGLKRTRKVDCQICGAVKEEGLRCEECGFPNIVIRFRADGRPLLFLPLCPSTNDRMRPIRMGRLARQILTDDARDYVASVGAALAPMLREIKHTTIEAFRLVGVWTILPRVGADPHNYGKVLFDALETAGAVKNDRFILPLYYGVWHDSKEPEIIVSL